MIPFCPFSIQLIAIQIDMMYMIFVYMLLYPFCVYMYPQTICSLSCFFNFIQLVSHTYCILQFELFTLFLKYRSSCLQKTLYSIFSIFDVLFTAVRYLPYFQFSVCMCCVKSIQQTLSEEMKSYFRIILLKSLSTQNHCLLQGP